MKFRGVLFSLFVTTGMVHAQYQTYQQTKPNFHPCAYGSCSCLPKQQIDTIKIKKALEKLKNCIHELEADYNTTNLETHNQNSATIMALTKSLEELKKILQEKNNILNDTTLSAHDKVALGIAAIYCALVTYCVYVTIR